LSASRRPAFGKDRVATVVLAAGAGTRLGGPKALLAWPSPKGQKPVPLAIAHAEERLGAESGRVLLVVRKPMLGSLLGYVQPGVDLLASDAADELGAAGSLAFAVSRLGEVDAAVVTPVDTPPAHADTVARLVAALAGDPALLAARPVCRGRAGHPVALRRAALERYAAPAPPPLREHLRALGPACGDVDVTDPTVLIDLDTPADVMGTLGALPRFFK
jgi:CTP:molybdopterin cytidylyltransferase MocA